MVFNVGIFVPWAYPQTKGKRVWEKNRNDLVPNVLPHNIEIKAREKKGEKMPAKSRSQSPMGRVVQA